MCIRDREYAVWSNGAAVSRLADGACLHRNCLPPEQVLAVLELLEPYPLAMELSLIHI